MKSSAFSTVSVLVLACTLVLTGCDKLTGQQQKIAWVDYSQLLAESVPGKLEQVHMAQVKEVLTKAEKSAQSTYSGMLRSEAARNRQADAITLNHQWVAEQQQARMKTATALNEVIEAYAADNGLSAVLPKENALAVVPAADITADIIAAAKDIKLDYGTLPEFSVKPKEPTSTDK